MSAQNIMQYASVFEIIAENMQVGTNIIDKASLVEFYNAVMMFENAVLYIIIYNIIIICVCAVLPNG